MEKLEPTHFTIMEGGYFHPWRECDRSLGVMHTIRFSDGSVFDALGWRPTKKELWGPCTQLVEGDILNSICQQIVKVKVWYPHLDLKMIYDTLAISVPPEDTDPLGPEPLDAT